MNPAGQLDIRAAYRDGQLHEIAVDLRRPPVSRLFVGQAPEVVVKTVPYLYSLCSEAQRAAAQAALAVAGDGQPRPVNDAALWTEVLHETLWRLLLDWPAAFGLPAARAEFAAWRAERQGDCAGATRRLLDGCVGRLAADCLAALDAADAAAAPAPIPDPAAWLPWWRGEAAAPPAPAMPGSIAAALRGRLAQLETAAQALADGRPFPVAAAGGGGLGLAQSATARGVLTHAVRVADGRVTDYRVLAPTDAFFRDAAGLSGLFAGVAVATRDAARRRLEQAVLALDPCLPYQLEINDA